MEYWKIEYWKGKDSIMDQCEDGALSEEIDEDKKAGIKTSMSIGFWPILQLPFVPVFGQSI
jgi:hypothetical protein